MLPNFLCIGAQKSGTTTLLNQLGRHPDIYMAPARETQFFLFDHLYSLGKIAYEIGFFQGWNGQKAVGEKTPEYLYDPVVPQRISDTLGEDVRFIVTFRSPAQRAYSHYRHNFQQFWESLSFEAAIAAEQSRCSEDRYKMLRYSYLDRGYYARQLSRYLNIFPMRSFTFVVYEKEIVVEQAALFRRIFEFLDVDPGFAPPGPESAGRAQPMVPRFIEKPELIEIDEVRLKAEPGDLLLTRQMMKPRLIKKPSAELVAFAQKVVKNMPLIQVLSREQELSMNQLYFRDDIYALEDMIQLDLKQWLED